MDFYYSTVQHGKQVTYSIYITNYSPEQNGLIRS